MIFGWKYGLIWVNLDIKYDGKWYHIDNCILDTGSATTAIDIDLVDFNYQKPAEIKRLRGIGSGTQEVVSQQLDSLIIGQSKLHDIEIEFGDIQEDLGINGFIGTDILSRFTLTIDFAQKTITLKPQ